MTYDGRVRSGFSLIELLVVIAIIGILAGLVMTAVQMAKTAAKRVKARNAVRDLVVAWTSYRQEYMKFPDIAISSMDSTAVPILRGGTNFHNLFPSLLVYNPLKIQFVDLKGTTTHYADPWGNDYQVALDRTGDNTITLPGAGGAVAVSVAVWSKGPDGRDFTSDDLSSWK